MKPARTMVLLPVVLLVFSASAQTNRPAADSGSLTGKNEPPSSELKEQVRIRCIEGRRSICGKILRMLPDGVLVESGYTNLLRAPLTKSWLVPAVVTVSPVRNLVESKEPGAICVGTVFVTDLPRGKPHLYDYVILCGYPTGDFSYVSVGSIKKTVRRFSANVNKAVNTTLATTTAEPSSTKSK